MSTSVPSMNASPSPPLPPPKKRHRDDVQEDAINAGLTHIKYFTIKEAESMSPATMLSLYRTSTVSLSKLGLPAPHSSSPVTKVITSQGKGHDEYYMYKGQRVNTKTQNRLVPLFHAMHTGATTIVADDTDFFFVENIVEIPTGFLKGSAYTCRDWSLCTTIMNQLSTLIPVTGFKSLHQLKSYGEAIDRVLASPETSQTAVMQFIADVCDQKLEEDARIEMAQQFGTTGKLGVDRCVAGLVQNLLMSDQTTKTFIENVANRLTIDAISTILGSLSFGLPLEKIGGHYADRAGQTLEPVPLNDCKPGMLVFTSAKAFSNAGLLKLSPSTMVFVIPPEGLFTKRSVNKKNSELLEAKDVPTEDAGLLKAVARLVEEKGGPKVVTPTVVANVPADEAVDFDF